MNAQLAFFAGLILGVVLTLCAVLWAFARQDEAK
jgi:hypothetical protein